MHLRLPALVCLLAAPVLAQPMIRVGLDTKATEWIVSLEGGGELTTRGGRPLLRLKDGEKVRLWWDSQGEADPTDEYRIQVGAPVELAAAEALMKRLRASGETPERKHVADGGTWRVLTGRFDDLAGAEPILQKLEGLGFEELWVATEPRSGKPRKGRALYAITERYERRPLPADGVAFRPKGELTKVEGKGRYRGRIEVFPNAQGRLTVMNQLDLETYLRGVVPREMGANEYPALEALKAQAIAARTYAFSNLGKRNAEGFDLLDTVADQVYGGRDGEQRMTDQAVTETAGLVATHGGKPIQALFMADGGGATIDNSFVFGGNAPYLKGVSSYAEKPLTLPFQGSFAPDGNAAWITPELMRLVAEGVVPPAALDGKRLGAALQASDLAGPVARLAERFHLPAPKAGEEKGTGLLLWAARALGFHKVVAGMERPQDATYFLGGASVAEADRPLAAFLARRGIVPAPVWIGAPTVRDGLLVLARLWQELEPAEWLEGTLLRDGQVRRKNGGPGPFPVAEALLLAEEAPGGVLRLVPRSDIQVGDRLRWIAVDGTARVVIRRLDPDGASLDRYNPTAHWKVELKESELLAKLQQRISLNAVGGLDLEHNDQGRVTKLTVRDGLGRPHVLTGMRIRGALGLKDNVFRYLTVGKGSERRWIFYGRGWGHGVGMDQTGAYGMALEGATHAQILSHYFTGIELVRAY